MASRSLKVRCTTWDQVEAFYTRKLKPGRELSVRLPFSAQAGSTITLALGLPNDLVMAIDGTVASVSAAADGKKSNVRLQLVGLTDEVLRRLKTLVADARVGHQISAPAGRPRREAKELAPPEPTDAPVDEVVQPAPLPTVDDVAAGEREVFFALEGEHRRLREAAAHEVLGVDWDARVADIRRAYFALTKRHHPDLYAKHRSQAILQLASEVFILVNKAYDRMREAAQAAGDAIIAGPALIPHEGWLAGFEDVGLSEQPSQTGIRALPRTGRPDTGRWQASEPSVKFTPAPEPAPASPPAPEESELAATNVYPAIDDDIPLGDTPSVADDDDIEMTIDVEPPPRRRKPETTPVPLTDDSLFGDVDMPEARQPTETSQVSQLFATGSADQQKQDEASELATEARVFLNDDQPAMARDKLVEALHLDPRNRWARALYHVANGRCLEADGKSVEAMTQYETALVHDRECEEAQAALRGESPRAKKKGLFRRLRKR